MEKLSQGPFHTNCPACGRGFELRPRFLNRKIVCDNCKLPFLAHDKRVRTIEVPVGLADVTPEEGWLIVCPCCAHTEIIAQGEEERAHCSMCDTALAPPVTQSKKIRKKIVETPWRKPREKH